MNSIVWPISQHRVIYAIVKYLIITIPIGIYGYVTLPESWNLPLQHDISVFFSAHLLLLILLLISPAFLNKLFALIDERIRVLEQVSLIPLLVTLEAIVQKQLSQTVECLRNRTRGCTAEEKLNKGVVDPLAHKIEVVKQIGYFFQKITSDENLEIVLVKIVNNKPVQCEVVTPERLVIEHKLMSEHAANTMFAKVAKERRAICIDDIAGHIKIKKSRNRYYYPTGNDECDRGSILCVPIIERHTNNVVAAYSVKSTTPKLISDNLRKHCCRGLHNFSDLLLLGHNWQSIKA